MASQEHIHQVAALTAAGHSVRDIADKTGLTRSTVNNYQHLDETGRLIKEGRKRIAARYVGIVDKYLDKVEAGDTNLSGTQLMVAYGIAQQRYDDTVKLEQPNPDIRQLVIVVPGLPPVESEGHIVTIDPD